MKNLNVAIPDVVDAKLAKIMEIEHFTNRANAIAHIIDQIFEIYMQATFQVNPKQFSVMREAEPENLNQALEQIVTRRIRQGNPVRIRVFPEEELHGAAKKSDIEKILIQFAEAVESGAALRLNDFKVSDGEPYFLLTLPTMKTEKNQSIRKFKAIDSHGNPFEIREIIDIDIHGNPISTKYEKNPSKLSFREIAALIVAVVENDIPERSHQTGEFYFFGGEK